MATIVRASDARHLILGTGRDAPDPGAAGLADFPTTTVEALSAEPAADDPLFPPDWEARQASWGRPTPDEVFELIFTSGTTGTPKGVMLTHDNVVAAIETFHRIVPPMEHRIVSLLPLSHLLEQAVALYYATDVGADVLYVRSRNPRVIFDALREHRVTSMVVVPQVLELFWSAIDREVDKSGRRATFDRARSIARHLPMALRRRLFASVHGPSRRTVPPVHVGRRVPAARAPAIMGGHRRHRAPGIRRHRDGHRHARPSTITAWHGGPPTEGVEMRLAEGSEIQFRGRTVFAGYWNAPDADRPGFTRTAGTGPATSATSTTAAGSSSPAGSRTSSCCRTGSTCTPRTSRTPSGWPDLRESVVVETAPGRIEAVVIGERSRVARRSSPSRRVRMAAMIDAASRRRMAPSARTSGSPGGGCGPTMISLGRTRSRSNVTRSAGGPPATPRSRSTTAADQPGIGIPTPRASRAAWMSGARASRDPSGTHE